MSWLSLDDCWNILRQQLIGVKDGPEDAGGDWEMFWANMRQSNSTQRYPRYKIKSNMKLQNVKSGSTERTKQRAKINSKS